jgi:hypothetical protein
MSLTGKQSSSPDPKPRARVTDGGAGSFSLMDSQVQFAPAVVVGAHASAEGAFRSVGMSPNEAKRAANAFSASAPLVTVSARMEPGPLHRAPSGVVLHADPGGAELAGVAMLFPDSPAPFALLAVLATQASADEAAVEAVVELNGRLTGQHWILVRMQRIAGLHEALQRAAGDSHG